jgi:tagaturonate epimerase
LGPVTHQVWASPGQRQTKIKPPGPKPFLSDRIVKIAKYTFGTGDRFAHQGRAQLQAILKAREAGVDVHPVWNKSNREHFIIKSQPGDVRAEADAAVAALGFTGAYYVDADHIGLKTVDAFIPASDFFTLDVADFTGKAAEADIVEAFFKSVRRYTGSLSIPGIDRPFNITEATVRGAASKFLLAVQEASRIYRHVEETKGSQSFITEVSVDETDAPQNPVELFLILAMIAEEQIPIQTIAPKFTGRFNKGVDYVGDLTQFEKEFDEDLSVIAFAIREFGLADSLKLSVHSGSDKFSIYPIINRLIKKHDAGLHVKTAGTTWLEEVIGLAESDGEGLALVKEIYAQAHERFAELAAPYSTVIDIDASKLPEPKSVMGWSSAQYAGALRHVESSPHYDPNFRQLLHVGFKVAAGMGKRFTEALGANEEIVGRNVTENLYDRHLQPIFA